MKVLIAEDDFTSRRMLEAMLGKWGYEVTVTRDGDEAWESLQSPDSPSLAIIDWMMPGKDGEEICRLVRATPATLSKYMILLTTRGGKEDIVTGLRAGADDYLTKPFDREELRARVQVGERILGLQAALANRVAELQEALGKIKTLEGILPICSYCKKIRDDKDYWQQLESYFSQHSETKFSHSICPECYEKHIKPELEALTKRKAPDYNPGWLKS